MSSSRSKGPSYLRYRKTKAKARIPLGNGKYRDVALGDYGSANSRAKFRAIVEEWEAAQASGAAQAWGLTVADLVAAHLVHAEQHYRHPDGRPTSELRLYLLACRQLLRLHAATLARDFGPVALKAVRAAMIESGYCRKVVNQHVGRIRRIWKWGVSEQLVPVASWQSLQSVAGLQRGRTKATDHPPIPPVSMAHVLPVLDRLALPLRAMVLVQLAAGMRPQDVCGMTVGEVDREGIVAGGVRYWVYRPSNHKTAWRGHSKSVVLGPAAQLVLRPYLEGKESHLPVFRKPRAPHRAYTRRDYGQRIEDACERAGIPKWSPNQLRHTAATAAQSMGGIDAARAVLGHRDAQVTTIYAERDLKLAAEVARKIG